MHEYNVIFFACYNISCLNAVFHEQFVHNLALLCHACDNCVEARVVEKIVFAYVIPSNIHFSPCI